MGLTIYGVLRSRASRPVWMARELGLAYTLVPVIQHYRLSDSEPDDQRLHTRSPAFLAINPGALVPSIDDDGLILHESLAITLYLARKHGGTLAPRDLREEGLVTMWSFWAATNCEADALRVLQNCAAVKSGDPALYAAGVAALGPKFAVLDAALRDGGGWLVGGRFTVADLNVAEILRYAQAAPELFAAAPHVQAWIAACQSRPAFIAMMAERNAEAA